MEIKLSQKLTQSLVMTPQLQQAIRLLQLPRLELIDEIRRELEANPVLADDDTDPRPRAELSELSVPLGDSSTAERTGETERFEHEKDFSLRNEEKRAQEVDWDQFLENRTLQQPTYATRGGVEELPPIEQTLTKIVSLQDHLMWQLQMTGFSQAERRFAEFIIGNLDERGYLDLEGIERTDGTKTPDMTIEDIAMGVGLDPEDAPEVLRLIQHFDPNGVASRTLAECLRIQAEIRDFDALELAIIDRHLHNLEKHNFQAIARDLKITLEDVYDAAREIQTLESRPARNYTDADDKLIAITPDVYIVKDGDRFVVLDNDRGVQRLYINEALTKRLLKDPNAKDFVGEKLRNAQWLIRAIEQRRKTIIRVMEAIVERQREFFEMGVAHLKPMILRDIAEAVGMHESTISRVTTNKYVHTSQGLFELKYFFNSSIRRTSSEDDVASESVKQAIKKIIEEEDKQNPLSDQAIVTILEKEKIQIARRTVAKYREMLGILASSRRKKMFLHLLGLAVFLLWFL